MYAAGADGLQKELCKQAVRDCLESREALVTDAEVLQEILHRYQAIGRFEAIDVALDFLIGAVDSILPIEPRDVLQARENMREIPRLSARDAIHLAVMVRHGIGRIMSRDTDFDGLPGIQRIWGT